MEEGTGFQGRLEMSDSKSTKQTVRCEHSDDISKCPPCWGEFTGDEMHEILMNYGKICEEQGFLSPKAVAIRMDIATHFYNMESTLNNQAKEKPS